VVVRGGVCGVCGGGSSGLVRFEERWDDRGAVGTVNGDGFRGVVGLKVKSTTVE
jgi:hypothetical protein